MVTRVRFLGGGGCDDIMGGVGISSFVGMCDGSDTVNAVAAEVAFSFVWY